MREFLVFQFYGPMASWGGTAVGEDRPSMGRPSKSATVGILAAASGFTRENEEEHQRLDHCIGFGVCLRSTSTLLRDFHTIQVPKGREDHSSRKVELTRDKSKLQTILSRRDYRSDGIYYVSIWNKLNSEQIDIDEIRKSLLFPHFTMYLGRKSCPMALPLNPMLISENTLFDAFEKYIHAAQTMNDQFLGSELESEYSKVYWESESLLDEEVGMQASLMFTRQDRILSRERWQFGSRMECYCEFKRNGAI